MAKLTLKLLVDNYDQLRNPDRGLAGGFDTRGKGDVFEARDQAEYDRLIDIGAAQDPEKAQQAEQERLQAEQERLEQQKAALDDQIKSLRGQAKQSGQSQG